MLKATVEELKEKGGAEDWVQVTSLDIRPPVPHICRTCFWWTDPNGTDMASHSCNNPKLRLDMGEGVSGPMEEDELLYPCDDWGNSLTIGPEFGCVHWAKREEDHEG